MININLGHSLMFFCVFQLWLLQFFYIRCHRNICVVSTGLKPSSPVLLQQWHRHHHNCWLPGLFFLVWRRMRVGGSRWSSSAHLTDSFENQTLCNQDDSDAWVFMQLCPSPALPCVCTTWKADPVLWGIFCLHTNPWNSHVHTLQPTDEKAEHIS